MIGRLRGILLTRQPPQLTLEVQGVGYDIEAPMSTFYELPPVGVEVVLHTHLVVRDDAHLLFGFATEAERAFFRSLLKVNGVGAKVALAILSGISVTVFARCVQDNDSASLTRLPGIGKKTAERLILEMRDRLSDWHIAPAPASSGLPGAALTEKPDPISDAVRALIALGYKPQEASRRVLAIDAVGLGSEQLIRRALQSMAKA
ncbi:Holliday junction branch migration protein RuvA [uncultured Sphaerotilus sp.]|uniref:Holliday junction branch migration protein RuvA n=1 Tax=uncultured Sphaerotilus sp. TaxID=474984 RepID=UPI0030CA534B